MVHGRSGWPCALRGRAAAAGLLGSRVRIQLRARMFVPCGCCVLCMWRPLSLADRSFGGVLPCVCKAVPLQAWTGPRGFQEVKVPRIRDNGTGWRYGCQPHAPAAFTPRKYSWYAFLLETVSTPGPYCDRKDFISIKNSNDTSWDRTSDLPICSTAL